MIKNYIHIYIYTPGELSRLFSLTSKINDEAKQRGYDITTKSQIIDFLCGEINNNKKACIDDLPKKIVLKQAHIVKRDLFIETISNVESYIMQSIACWELWKKHFSSVYNYVNDCHLDKEGIHAIIDKLHNNKDPEWRKKLTKIRNLIEHEGSLNIAVDLNRSVSENREKWQLIFMKKNLHDFRETKKYFTFQDLIEMHEGYFSSIRIIRSEIDKLMAQVKN